MRDGHVWVLRLLWFLLPLTVGAAVDDALASTSSAISRTVTVELWVVWVVGVLATAVLLPLTLTIVRILAPAALTLALWALAGVDVTPLAVVGAVHSALVVVAVLNPVVGDRFVDGASYGDERRMLLRPPASIAYVIAPAVWAVVVAGAVAGPLLLADRQWLLGLVVLVVGVLAMAAGIRALHQLTRRWIVFVPTGMVLHDHSALTEPVLFRRTAIERLGAALAGSPARDLSRGAPGLLLECELADPAPLGLRAGNGTSDATMTDVRRFLFCPTRPGELLNEAERRNIAVD